MVKGRIIGLPKVDHEEVVKPDTKDVSKPEPTPAPEAIVSPAQEQDATTPEEVITDVNSEASDASSAAESAAEVATAEASEPAAEAGEAEADVSDEGGNPEPVASNPNPDPHEAEMIALRDSLSAIESATNHFTTAISQVTKAATAIMNSGLVGVRMIPTVDEPLDTFKERAKRDHPEFDFNRWKADHYEDVRKQYPGNFGGAGW